MTHGKQKWLGVYSGALFVDEALNAEEVQEWVSVPVMQECLTGNDDLYNPLC